VQVAVLVPAVLGRFTLWGAVLVDVGSSLLVVANALRWAGAGAVCACVRRRVPSV
jgi:cation transport ATPase